VCVTLLLTFIHSLFHFFSNTKRLLTKRIVVVYFMAGLLFLIEREREREREREEKVPLTKEQKKEQKNTKTEEIGIRHAIEL
jgi:predicted membrane protein